VEEVSRQRYKGWHAFTKPTREELEAEISQEHVLTEYKLADEMQIDATLVYVHFDDASQRDHATELCVKPFPELWWRVPDRCQEARRHIEQLAHPKWADHIAQPDSVEFIVYAIRMYPHKNEAEYHIGLLFKPTKVETYTEIDDQINISTDTIKTEVCIKEYVNF
jgi:hypothetical protein